MVMMKILVAYLHWHWEMNKVEVHIIQLKLFQWLFQARPDQLWSMTCAGKLEMLEWKLRLLKLMTAEPKHPVKFWVFHCLTNNVKSDTYLNFISKCISQEFTKEVSILFLYPFSQWERVNIPFFYINERTYSWDFNMYCMQYKTLANVLWDTWEEKLYHW